MVPLSEGAQTSVYTTWHPEECTHRKYCFSYSRIMSLCVHEMKTFVAPTSGFRNSPNSTKQKK